MDFVELSSNGLKIIWVIEKRYVSYNSCESEQNDTVYGVPQGSILGPLLFILYVSDLTNISNVLEFILFADDTTILYSHPNIDNQINCINEELKELLVQSQHVFSKC